MRYIEVDIMYLREDVKKLNGKIKNEEVEENLE